MGTGGSLIVSYRRGGGRRPPPDRELLAINDDGSFMMWRSVASATYPSTPVGRFAGTVPSETMAALKSEISAAQAVGAYQYRSSPDSAAETIEIGQIRADLGVHDKPANAWAPLAIRLRGFLSELVQFPNAALALVVTADGQRVQLVRKGDQPLRVDLRAVTLRAALWKPAESVTLKEWSSQSMNLGGTVTTPPDWTLDLPMNAGFTMVEGGAVHASATLRLFDGDVPVDVALSS